MKTIKEIHHDWLTLPDGTRLAYRAWLPKDSEQNPVPAILEFLPYRKGDGTIVRDEITLPQTAQQGYACIRVDIRGCGESEGLFNDEYSAQELQDGCDVIAWIADQPWCSGQVGLVGISWGGFNSLQIAALNPPALKGIITQCSTDDRYRDDIHFTGGCLLNDNMDWAAFFWAYAEARAPDKALVGDDWQAIWLKRLQQMPFLATKWISEQTRSDYWKHASICENYDDIKIPVYAIGGWADAYRNTVFSLLQNLKVPRKGLVGPWAHKYPNIAYPNPKIDYVKESVRWWDYCLKGIDNGIINEPILNYYLQDSVPPQVDYDFRAGQWVSEDNWPSTNTDYQTWYFTETNLQLEQNSNCRTLSVCSPQTVGLDGGRFCVGIRLDMEQAADQRLDDAGSLTFDSAPLNKALPIAGQPIVRLKITSDKAHANLIVRICDVHPNGSVTKISHGILNLTHRDSHEFPQALAPNTQYDIQIPVNHIAYIIPKGHQLRISISTAYWPLIWPSPEQATIQIKPSDCQLILPLNHHPKPSNFIPEYDAPVQFAGKVIRPTSSKRIVHRDYKTGMVTLETAEDFGRNYYNSANSEIDFTVQQCFSIHPNDPLTAKNELSFKVEMGRPGWWTSINNHYQMTSDKENFYIKATWQAFSDNKLLFEKTFNETIKRNFM